MAEITAEERIRLLSKPYVQTKDIQSIYGVGRALASKMRDKVYKESIVQNYYVNIDAKTKYVPTDLLVQMYPIGKLTSDRLGL